MPRSRTRPPTSPARGPLCPALSRARRRTAAVDGARGDELEVRERGGGGPCGTGRRREAFCRVAACWSGIDRQGNDGGAGLTATDARVDDSKGVLAGGKHVGQWPEPGRGILAGGTVRTGRRAVREHGGGGGQRRRRCPCLFYIFLLT
jgi:hypothetical protein